MRNRPLVLAALLCVATAEAGELTKDAAIGGGVGGALGGAVGAELGGREGAIIGAGLGAAAGAALNTQDAPQPSYPRHEVYYPEGPANPHGSGFCPPGQRKKGRC